MATATKAMTEMASNLTKDWIQYLKNSQIVGMQSDPKSGKLNYKRKVTADDVTNFLRVKTDYDDKAIANAIQQVVGSRQATASNLPAVQQSPQSPQSRAVATQQAPEMTPGQRQPYKPPLAPPERVKKYSNVDATDAEFREPGSRKAVAGNTKRLKEEFTDQPGNELSEEEVESIFGILSRPVAEPEKQAAKQVDPQEKRLEELNKLKKFIRDTLNDQQRMSLWRALQDA